MELLGRIIPAIRETRVPLVSGYVWLLAIWLSVAVGSDRFAGEPEPGSQLAVLREALGALGGLGLGIADSVTAFMVGSMAGFLADLLLKPRDSRAMRDHAARSQAEAQLRFQLAAPLLVGSVIVVLQSRQWLWLLGTAIPGVLVVHGAALWQRARDAPLKADLRGVDLSDAHLYRANFTNVDLTGANLQGANLAWANLYAAKLGEVQLNGAVLDWVNLDEIDGGLTVEHLRQVGSMTGARLTGARISGDLSRANLDHVNFEGADLTALDLREANLSWTTFADANLREADLSGTDLTGARFNEYDYSKGEYGRGAVLTGANLAGAIFSYAKLSHVDLSGVNLARARFQELDSTDGYYGTADLSSADLSGADLSGADLSGADLSGANLSGADLSNLMDDERTIWPDAHDQLPHELGST